MITKLSYSLISATGSAPKTNAVKLRWNILITKKTVNKWQNAIHKDMPSKHLIKYSHRKLICYQWLNSYRIIYVLISVLSMLINYSTICPCSIKLYQVPIPSSKRDKPGHMKNFKWGLNINISNAYPKFNNFLICENIAEKIQTQKRWENF